MKHKILFFIFLVFLGIALTPPSYAWFPENHAYYALSELRKINTGIAGRCGNYEEQVMLGLAGADVPVIHYLENNLAGYKGTHSRALYKECINNRAGSDVELQCVCYGIGLHLVADRTSHYEFVPKYIKKYLLSNVLVHPVVENDAKNQLLDRLDINPDYAISADEVVEQSKYSLDLYFDANGDGVADTTNKYQQLFDDISNLDMYSDFYNVRAALVGEVWGQAVYGKDVSKPAFYWFLSISGIVIGITWLVFTYFVGRNNWKYLSYVIGIIFLLIGLILLLSLITNNSFIWFKGLSTFLAYFMNIEDTTSFDNEVLYNTGQFLQGDGEVIVNGQIIFDASGLDHTDLEGNEIKGPLSEAEKPYRYFVYPAILITVLSLLILLFWAMSRK